MRSLVLGLLLLASAACADEALPVETLFRGNMVLPWSTELRTYAVKSLPALGESGLWSQLPVEVRQELSRSQEGLSLSRLAAVSSPAQAAQIVSLSKRGKSLVVGYAVLDTPGAPDEVANVHVVRIPKRGKLSFERVQPAAAAGLAGQLDPQSDPLKVCHQFDCKARTGIELPESVWGKIETLFPAPSADAAEERARLARAIGLLEAEVGPLVGTGEDKGGWSGNAKGGSPGQQDCLDESANTASYLGLLLRRGFVRFHRPEETKRRGFFATHFTASMRELASGQLYAVDAWFRDNGEPAVIQRFEAWKKKAKPEPSPGPVVVDQALGSK